MLRVIAGKYRRRLLEQPPREITRPARDMVKESFFSMIQFRLENSSVLDLFAGSASLAIEALSRGAKEATAVDLSDEAIKVINKNIDSIKVENLKVVKANVLDFLEQNKGKKWDFIFLDPPYAMTDLYNKSLELISKNDQLNEKGNVILETDEPQKIITPDRLVLIKEKKYGKTYILFYGIKEKNI